MIGDPKYIEAHLKKLQMMQKDLKNQEPTVAKVNKAVSTCNFDFLVIPLWMISCWGQECMAFRIKKNGYCFYSILRSVGLVVIIS